jgi:acetyl esterase/lipase
MCHWTLDYVHTHGAILVAPNHRLMPEATGAAIASDVSSFWAWLFSPTFTQYLSVIHPGTEPDLTHICCTGASAGGYLAVQSAFTPNQAGGRIRAVIGAYPMLDMSDEVFGSEAASYHPMGLPTLPVSIVEEHLELMRPDAVVSAADPPKRHQLAVAMLQHGRWKEFFGEGEELNPMKTMERVDRAAECPFVFLFHGTGDSSVPVEGTMKFAEGMRERFGDDKCHLYTGPGEHGLDLEVGVDDSWMRIGLAKVTEAWLGEYTG